MFIDDAMHSRRSLHEVVSEWWQGLVTSAIEREAYTAAVRERRRAGARKAAETRARRNAVRGSR